MNKTCLLALCLLGGLFVPFASAQAAPFLATFRTTVVDEEIRIPLQLGPSYNFVVDWGDGNTSDVIMSPGSVDRYHTYAVPGDHTISVTGRMPMWDFARTDESRENFIRLDSAGDVQFGEGITNFSDMFSDCTNLTSVALFDTSSGTDFSGMFEDAANLTNVPAFNTSNGLNFSQMFLGAGSLVNVPLFDTGNGTDFSGMFYGTTLLASVPTFDTGKGIIFSSMFRDSDVITTIPLLDTGNGEDFSHMFSGSDAITTIPLLETGKGTAFNGMFNGAVSLESIPLIDVSNGVNFWGMFNLAEKLKTVPVLDTSSGTNFGSMFAWCYDLTDIPLIDVSSGTSFSSMFNKSNEILNGAVRGARYSIDYMDKKMEATALLNLFSEIGVADTSGSVQTLRLNSNPGLDDLTAEDYVEVLSKGWTISPTPPVFLTCFDGIKNQDETYIDCGGETCLSCNTCISYTSEFVDLLHYYRETALFEAVTPSYRTIYYDCELNSFGYGNSSNQMANLPDVSSSRGSTSEIELINRYNMAENKKLYYDNYLNQFKIGDETGALIDIDGSARILNNLQIQSETDALEGVSYFNSTNNKYYIGLVDGSLAELLVVD